ncbi:MAG TPA: RimK family alpha-L-glutamate ligase [Candidatus Nanoarchaeia archaeon]|nr:RimK family alpha-L-glutamate ligase [Candidatus Nanoarchaeia archaeon]
MKAALISLGSKSSEWTAEAMRKYFTEVDMIPLKEMEAKIGPEAGVYHNGEPIKKYDCMYIKGSFRYANLLQAISSLLYDKCYMPIEPHAFSIVHNKLLTHLELQKYNIPMPRTYVAAGTKEAKKLLDQIQYPIVMKMPEGTQGKGVMIADSRASASSMLDALGALKQPFILQEFLDSGDVDIRAFVVGNEVVASMMRVAKRGESRANLHAGGKGKAYTLGAEEKKIAIKAAEALGAEICGVDMLQGAKGPVIIEANVSPGLQGITKATGIDSADKIAKYLYDQTKKRFDSKTNNAAQKMLNENAASEKNEIITNLTVRGEHIVLPSIVTKLTGFNGDDDYTIKAEKGRLMIEDFAKKNGNN